MPAPNEPPSSGSSTNGPQTPASPQQRMAKARPESTVTLMIQSGQAPGGLHPAQAQGSPPAPRPNLFARAWAAFKGWF